MSLLTLTDNDKKNNMSKTESIELLRYTFTDEFNELLEKFAFEHKEDTRIGFNTEWQEWINGSETAEKIQMEIKRLEVTGFTGDIMDKMFKSVKYYFIKKLKKVKIVKGRKVYTTLSKELLENMDEHIKQTIEKHMKMVINPKENKNIICISNISPAESYIDYCNENKSIIVNAIIEFKKQNDFDTKVFSEKLKKTYKNRFYNLRKNL